MPQRNKSADIPDQIKPRHLVGLFGLWDGINRYFAIAAILWRTREDHHGSSVIREIDNFTLSILNAPRVRSTEVTRDGMSYWEVSLALLLELPEQSDEIIHHINSRAAYRWDKFCLPQSNIHPTYLLPSRPGLRALHGHDLVRTGGSDDRCHGPGSGGASQSGWAACSTGGIICNAWRKTIAPYLAFIWWKSSSA